MGRELSLARVAEERAGLERYDRQEVVGYCLDGIRRVGEHRRAWPVEAQSRVQRLVLPQGVAYNVLTGNRTPELSLVYQVFPNPFAGKSNQAPPAWRVTNQVIEEMSGWYEARKGLPLAPNASPVA